MCKSYTQKKQCFPTTAHAHFKKWEYQCVHDTNEINCKLIVFSIIYLNEIIIINK